MYQVAIGWWWGIDSPLVRPPSWTWGDCNGGENDEKNIGKNEGIWRKTMGKEWENPWRIWVERLENWLEREEKRWKEWGEGKMMPSKLEAPMWDHYRAKHAWNNGKAMEKLQFRCVTTMSRSTEIKPWKKRAKPVIRCNCRDCGRCIWVSVRHQGNDGEIE